MYLIAYDMKRPYLAVTNDNGTRISQVCGVTADRKVQLELLRRLNSGIGDSPFSDATVVRDDVGWEVDAMYDEDFCPIVHSANEKDAIMIASSIDNHYGEDMEGETE